ncbi:hypothetical protein GGF43_006400, partial [Coemansia sp. RSA 2618]
LDGSAANGGLRAPRTAVQKLIDLDLPPSNSASNGGQSMKSGSASSMSTLDLPEPSSTSHAWWMDDGLPVGRSKAPATNIASVNPFAPTVAAINISSSSPDTSGTPHARGAAKPAPPSNIFDDDPFADDGSDIPWKPMAPS